MEDLYFDILGDLSDSLPLEDFYVFLMINDLSFEIIYDPLKVVRRVEYYQKVRSLSKWTSMWSDICTEGDLEVLKWIKHYKSNTYKFRENVLILASRHGHLEVIKWLLDNYRWTTTFRYLAIIRAYEEGHFNIAKWLYNTPHKNDPCNIKDLIRHANDFNVVGLAELFEK